MKEELEYSFKKLSQSLDRLKESVHEPESVLVRDSVIQRLEFTFELLWKTLKRFLDDQGVEAKTPKSCLEEAFRLGWLKNDQLFLDMLRDRNITSHVYQEEKAIEVYQHIKQRYVEGIEEVVNFLKEFLST